MFSFEGTVPPEMAVAVAEAPLVGTGPVSGCQWLSPGTYCLGTYYVAIGGQKGWPYICDKGLAVPLHADGLRKAPEPLFGRTFGVAGQPRQLVEGDPLLAGALLQLLLVLLAGHLMR